MTKADWMYDSPELLAYYQTEWGKPEHDDQRLFELLCMELYQAGLSWRTVLNKRAAFRTAFKDYEIAKVAQMTPTEIEQLLTNPAIIRNRAKLNATVNNAQALLALQKSAGSFDQYLWGFVDGQPIVNRPRTWADVPAKSELSTQISKDLKRRGFQFVGPVIIYSFLQGAGVIDDHLMSQ
ncbi:DNA-3-methyladenine glycosylase I [Latilactobacillus curvatus]|uniref:DNA-3-methyladenine glycosylase I n=1 Tax=Latilactobacillus curvatus TaxID=28038 RepID=A0AAC9UPN3_LATCU|nr:DNA-3-methyladenine glycosylase I [Latilactobacillus curvatus]ASN59150.1 DNA-3-methyladenine glycosylase I [Latilactobacillus curvatus]MDG2979746.1 DNA-3-methyladenine glycosylase I [Latilactobacillus curvatus]MDT3394457.1 DNA-3-methyladenine glycosylase I [Bacillota bacterium]